MLTENRPLDPKTVRSFFKQNRERLTPAQLADALSSMLSQIEVLGLRAGNDGKIGPPEIDQWEASQHPALFLRDPALPQSRL